MAQTVKRDNDHDRCERVLIAAIGRYDIKKFLVAASASRFEVISEGERKEIVGQAGSSEKMRESFEKLIVEKDRLKNLASFILDYNGRVQKAALAVLSPVKRPAPELANKGGYSSSEGEESASSSSSTSRTPPSPMDIDTKDCMYSQEWPGDMPSQQPPDVGYVSDLSKEISQEQTRFSYGNTFQTVREENTNLEPTISATMRRSHRKHKKLAKHYQDDRSVRKNGINEQECLSASHLLASQLPSNVDVDSSCEPKIKDKKREASSPLYNEKTDTHSWPPAHCEEIIQSLDMESLLPHLLKNGLLTRGECEMINFYKEMPSKQNSYFLLNVLQRKGTDGSKRFLESLKSEKEHLGHQDLVKLLDV